MNFLERTGTSLLMSTLLCAPARSDDSTKQPSYEDILELLLEAEKRVKEAKTESRKVPCDELSLQRIEAARSWIRANLKLEKELSENLGKAQVFCPNSERSRLPGNMIAGIVIEMPSQTSPGSYGVYPLTFSDPCELVSTVIHEEAHLIKRQGHDSAGIVKDAFYLLDMEAGKVCRQQAWHY
ncbi:MAG: hypothetical protein AAB383_03420 [Patescibacteria group bacterium]